MDVAVILNELNFKAIRSSGSGGQHVNKVSSKIELAFNIQNSEGFTEIEKELLKSKLQSKLSKEHVLILQCGESRSQHKNKEIVIKRFIKLINNSLKVQKKRKPTKPHKTSIEKRLEKKKKQAHKKAFRKKPEV